MKCNDINELLSLYIDRMLDESQTKEVEEHLSSCDSCRTVYNELKGIVDLLGQSEMVPVPDAFQARLREALAEERKNAAVSGVIGKGSRKNRWRIITSIAAVFAVGVITLSLYHDVLGILPGKLAGEEMSGKLSVNEMDAAPEAESPQDAPDGQTNDIYSIAAAPDMASDSSIALKNEQENGLQPMSKAERSATAGTVQNSLTGTAQKSPAAGKADNAVKDETASEEMAPLYGYGAAGSLPESSGEGDGSTLADSGEPEQTYSMKSKEFSANDNEKRKTAAPPEECSRSLTSLGTERNTAAIQYYNNLIEDRLKDFDYQILDSSYGKTGEWRFKVFIFRGKDGNTYNEEILILGKDGEITVICSNEFMGL